MNGDILTSVLIGYLFGSIPFGLLMTKIAGVGDIRNIGSGNIGATNVLRTGRKSLAAATLIMDAAKGALSIFIAGLFLSDTYLTVVGASSVIGHCFPIWLKFSGGKGVATGMAVVTMLSPASGLLCIATWLLVAFLLKYSSLSALAAFFISSISSVFLETGDITISIIFISLLVFFRHKKNIWRLITGNEDKIATSFRSKPRD